MGALHFCDILAFSNPYLYFKMITIYVSLWTKLVTNFTQ